MFISERLRDMGAVGLVVEGAEGVRMPPVYTALRVWLVVGCRPASSEKMLLLGVGGALC